MLETYIEIPDELKKYMNLIIDAGYECYLVGGAVRDALLGVSNKDYDFCTNIPFDKLKDLVPNLSVMKENSHRNTAVMRVDGLDVEFTMFRGNSLKEDLSNRDFTINAIAVDVNGMVIDYFNGLDDIKNKKVRLVKTFGFDFDALRILRTIRFTLKYEFNIDDDTKKEMFKNKKLLKNVAGERVFEELKKIIVYDDFYKVLDEYREIFFELIPELSECNNFGQYNNYHIYDVYTHIINVVKNIPNDIYLRFAALFHDIGKPRVFKRDDKGVGHFLGHPKASCDIFKKFADTYRLDNKTRKIVSDLILYHDDNLSIKTNKIYNFYKKFNMDRIEMLFKLKEADIKGQNPIYISRLDYIREVEDKYLEVRNEYKSILYNGSDLIKLGFSGKIIGVILDDVRINIINGNLKNDYLSINNYVLKKYKIECSKN